MTEDISFRSSSS